MYNFCFLELAVQYLTINFKIELRKVKVIFKFVAVNHMFEINYFIQKGLNRRKFRLSYYFQRKTVDFEVMFCGFVVYLRVFLFDSKFTYSLTDI